MEGWVGGCREMEDWMTGKMDGWLGRWVDGGLGGRIRDEYMDR